jgi:hypothetical protein
MATQWDTMHSARRAELEAQGVPPHIAMEQAAMEAIRARQAQVAATIPRDADGRPSLDDDEAAFDASMADAMGQSNLAAAATPLEMEPEFGQPSRPTPVYRRAPGPVDYGTGESEAGEDIYSDKEAAAYRYRKPTAAAGLPVAATPGEVEAAMAPGGPYRGGEYLPSQEDSDMYARGMIYNVNPRTGAAGYSVAYPDTEAAGALGVPGRLGSRQDLRQPVRDPRTGQLIPGTHKYEKDIADSPLGQVEVYRPSPEFREQLDAQERRKRIERLGAAAGMDDADIVAMASGEGPVDLEALRSAGRLRRQAGREERLAEVSRRAMERQNPTALLNDEWRQFVYANEVLGGNRAGPSPSAVRAAELAQRPAPPDPMAVVNAQDARQEAAVLVDARKRAANGHLGMSLLGYNEYDQAEYVLRGMGITPEQKEQVLKDLFPNGKPLYPWQEREAAERAAGGR